MTLPSPQGVADPNVWRKLIDGAETFAVNAVVAAVILVLTFWIARWASHLVRRALGRFSRTREDRTLQGFGASLARWAVVIVGLIAVLTRLGVETTSVIAVLGAASLAVGLALQGTLANVAAGVMLLLFRPYRVGDLVEIAGKQGVVQHLDLFTTELATLDNVQLTAPNGKIFGDFILNFSAHPTRPDRRDLSRRLHREPGRGAGAASGRRDRRPARARRSRPARRGGRDPGELGRCRAARLGGHGRLRPGEIRSADRREARLRRRRLRSRLSASGRGDPRRLTSAARLPTP
jgi:small conductance mechanosensitive channel